MLKSLLVTIALITPLAVQALDHHPKEGPVAKLGRKIDALATDAVIMAKFAQDPLLSPLDIKVSFKNGTVYLKGTLDTSLQVDRAVMLAANTNDVEDVSSIDLKVRDSKEPLNDVLLNAKIKGRLLKHKFVDGDNMELWPIKVSVKNGKVYVIGKVDSRIQKDNILEVIEKTPDVENVKEDILIQTS